jgi:hypothetical protein
VLLLVTARAVAAAGKELRHLHHLPHRHHHQEQQCNMHDSNIKWLQSKSGNKLAITVSMHAALFLRLLKMYNVIL